MHSVTEPNRLCREHSTLYLTWSNHWAMADVGFGVAAGVLGDLRSREGFGPAPEARRPADHNFDMIAVPLLPDRRGRQPQDLRQWELQSVCSRWTCRST